MIDELDALDIYFKEKIKNTEYSPARVYEFVNHKNKELIEWYDEVISGEFRPNTEFFYKEAIRTFACFIHDFYDNRHFFHFEIIDNLDEILCHFNYFLQSVTGLTFEAGRSKYYAARRFYFEAIDAGKVKQNPFKDPDHIRFDDFDKFVVKGVFYGKYHVRKIKAALQESLEEGGLFDLYDALLFNIIYDSGSGLMSMQDLKFSDLKFYSSNSDVTKSTIRMPYLATRKQHSTYMVVLPVSQYTYRLLIKLSELKKAQGFKKDFYLFDTSDNPKQPAIMTNSNIQYRIRRIGRTILREPKFEPSHVGKIRIGILSKKDMESAMLLAEPRHIHEVRLRGNHHEKQELIMATLGLLSKKREQSKQALKHIKYLQEQDAKEVKRITEGNRNRLRKHRQKKKELKELLLQMSAEEEHKLWLAAQYWYEPDTIEDPESSKLQKLYNEVHSYTDVPGVRRRKKKQSVKADQSEDGGDDT